MCIKDTIKTLRHLADELECLETKLKDPKNQTNVEFITNTVSAIAFLDLCLNTTYKTLLEVQNDC
jgi:hypothetical protein